MNANEPSALLPANAIVPFNECRLSYSYAGLQCVLEFDNEYLTKTFGQDVSDVTKTPLWRIMPELVVESGIPRSQHGALVWIPFGVASVVVWFSDIRPHVPLLAPALLIFGIFFFYRFASACFPLRKTKIVTEWGETLAVIPHRKEIEDHRRRFELALLNAVRGATSKS